MDSVQYVQLRNCFLLFLTKFLFDRIVFNSNLNKGHLKTTTFFLSPRGGYSTHILLYKACFILIPNTLGLTNTCGCHANSNPKSLYVSPQASRLF
jgi:hypothetical protein